MVVSSTVLTVLAFMFIFASAVQHSRVPLSSVAGHLSNDGIISSNDDWELGVSTEARPCKLDKSGLQNEILSLIKKVDELEGKIGKEAKKEELAFQARMQNDLTALEFSAFLNELNGAELALAVAKVDPLPSTTATTAKPSKFNISKLMQPSYFPKISNSTGAKGPRKQ